MPTLFYLSNIFSEFIRFLRFLAKNLIFRLFELKSQQLWNLTSIAWRFSTQKAPFQLLHPICMYSIIETATSPLWITFHETMMVGIWQADFANRLNLTLFYTLCGFLSCPSKFKFREAISRVWFMLCCSDNLENAWAKVIRALNCMY